MTAQHNLRSTSGTYILGEEIEKILGSKLPSNKQVLGFFIYVHRENVNLRECAKITYNEIKTFWEKARIPIKKDTHCVDAIVALYEKWRSLKKLSNRRIPSQLKMEEDFVNNLNDLFDISHANAKSLIEIPEDWTFLEMQRQKYRPGIMSKDWDVVNQIEACCFDTTWD